jgi:DNA-binding PucR family transcriptional regulator
MAARAARPLVRFEDLGVLRLMAGADPRAAERFATDWLGGLAAHDETRNGELLNTLAAFLDSGASYAACAETLGIHVSTLRYRLKRVADITGHDLTDSEVRFNLQLALRANGSLHALHDE